MMLGIRSLTSFCAVAAMRPRFASKLLLTPIQIPNGKRTLQDVFLVDPSRNPDQGDGIGLVFPGKTLGPAQTEATWVSLPDQSKVEKGHIVLLDVPKEEDDAAAEAEEAEKQKQPPAGAKERYFLSGPDLSAYARKARAALLNAFTSDSDHAVKAQEAGNWEGARYLFDQIIAKYKPHVIPVAKGQEATMVFLPPVAFANTHWQYAKTMWGVHHAHWVTTSYLDSATKLDPTNAKFRAFRHYARIQFTEDQHAQACENPDFLKAVHSFARNQPEQALQHVQAALQYAADNPVIRAFKSYLEQHEIQPDYDF